MTPRTLLAQAGHALLDQGRDLDDGELAALAALPDEAVPSLAALAHEVRLARCGPAVEVEGILSAKTGGCPEDCHFCSQSGRFETNVRPTGLLDLEDVLSAARETARIGASEFCIVMALRGPSSAVVDRVLEATALIRARLASTWRQASASSTAGRPAAWWWRPAWSCAAACCSAWARTILSASSCSASSASCAPPRCR